MTFSLESLLRLTLRKSQNMFRKKVIKNTSTVCAKVLIFKWEMGQLSIFLCGYYNYLLSTIKIGRISQSHDQISANILTSIHDILSYLILTPAKPKHIRQISIKTAKSVSLSVFS